MLQLAGELDNHRLLDDLKRHYDAGDMKAFYATAERVLRVKCGNPVVRSLIVGEELVTDRDQVEKHIAQYFEGVYRDESRADGPDGRLAPREELLSAARDTQGLFSREDVVEAIKACNFNKGLGPDGFDGSILQPDRWTQHRLT